MAQYILDYKDGSSYTIEIDVANKDIKISRTKAGNVRSFIIKDFGISLVRDDVIMNVVETQKDADGDDIIGFKGFSRVINDKTYFNAMIQYTNDLGIIGQAYIVIDTLLKEFLQQTRVFNPDGSYQQPIYFSLQGTSPDNDPDFNNGTITVNIIVDAGLTDLEARLRPIGGAWSAWTAVVDGQVVQNRTSGTYEMEMRSAGTPLLIQPIETISI